MPDRFPVVLGGSGYLPLEDREYFTALVGEELLPQLDSLAWEHSLWEELHQSEPRRAEIAKKLLAAAKKTDALLDSLKVLEELVEPSDPVLLVAALHPVASYEKTKNAIESLRIGLKMAADRINVEKGRGKDRSSAVRSLAWQLGELFQQNDLELVKSRDSAYFKVFDVLLDAVGHPLQDALTYASEAIDGLGEKRNSPP